MKNNSVVLSGFIFLFCVGMTFAQSGFLKIGDIKGEATEKSHRDWIDIETMSQGLMQQKATSGASRRRGAVVLEDLIITKRVDKATPKLMDMCAKGMVVPQLELDMVTNTGRLYYKLTLHNLTISSINTSTICDPDCELIDEVAISYSKVTWEYWDAAGNKTSATYNQPRGN